MNREEFEEFLLGIDDSSSREAYSQYLETVFQDLTGDKLLYPATDRFTTPEARKLMRLLQKDSISGNRSTRRWFMGIAAGLSVVFAIYLGYHNKAFFQKPIVQQPKYPTPSIQLPAFESVTPRGKKGTVNLTDGSKVFLNAASRISLDTEYNLASRKISLSGEAFFDVTPNQQKPFLISTDEIEIEVVGTSFNVKAYSEDPTYTVTVTSGKVIVHCAVPGPEGNRDIVLHQNQKLVYVPGSGSVQVQEVQPDDDISWRTGTLRFDKTPIREVERMLERWYDVDLIIKDYSIYNQALTGVHRNENLKSVMEALTYATGTKYDVKDNCIIIKKATI